jgi:hypothetical protein
MTWRMAPSVMVSWLFFRPAFLQHARPQVMLGDGELFLGDVAGEADHLHAVEQRRGDGELVGGADEQGLRQVEAHVEVVVEEIGILFGVEHFQQRRGRVAVVAGADLVDLVEHDDRVGRPRLLQRLDELARHGADVGAAMPLDFGLVAHAANREAEELAPQRLGDRFADRGLANARRADQQQDRARHFALHRAHREEFDDAVLDVLEAIMVAVEDLACPRQVELVLGQHAPRQHRQPVEIVAGDGVFG